MWTQDALIFEEDGEDEEAMISEFVRLSALYPEEQPQSITEYIFKNLRDPGMRSLQAAVVWARDLDIKERIRLAKRKGVDEPKEYTIHEWEAEVLALTRDATVLPNEKKAMLEGYMNIATIKGWVKKAIDKTVTNNTSRLPVIVFAPYPDA
jgi:hypothetical protein